MFPQHFSCIILFCGMREEPHTNTVRRMRRVMVCVRISHPSYTKLIQPLHINTCILTAYTVFYSSVFLSCCPVKRSMPKLLKRLIHVFREFLYLNLFFLPHAIFSSSCFSEVYAMRLTLTFG